MTMVDAVYNWQWGRMVQVDRRLLQRMQRAGYVGQHTGGGCMGWQKPLDDGGYVLITGEAMDLGSWDERELMMWTVGRYGGADLTDWIVVAAALTLADALALGERLPAPTTGEQGLVGCDLRRGEDGETMKFP